MIYTHNNNCSRNDRWCVSTSTSWWVISYVRQGDHHVGHIGAHSSHYSTNDRGVCVDLDVVVGDLLGRGLFDDAVLGHDVPLDVRSSDERRLRLGRRRDGELLDVSERAGRRGRLHLLLAVDTRLEPVLLHDSRLVRRLDLSRQHTTTTTSSNTSSVKSFTRLTR